jgi:hypothetical protein
MDLNEYELNCLINFSVCYKQQLVCICMIYVHFHLEKISKGSIIG